MTKDYLDYSRLVDEAMHYVVRQALKLAQKYGLTNNHHFFITFQTNYAGVMMSDELKTRYPEEMTIVLQHQFWNLEVEENHFSVVLSFDGVKQNLTIPFDALVSFADPSVKFGLQFHREPTKVQTPSDAEVPLATSESISSENNQSAPSGSNVIKLDNFRKK